MQLQASLTAANTSAPAQATDVGAILATEDIAMVRFPDTAAQQIGQVMEGWVIQVTGVSEDGA